MNVVPDSLRKVLESDVKERAPQHRAFSQTQPKVGQKLEVVDKVRVLCGSLNFIVDIEVSIKKDDMVQVLCKRLRAETSQTNKVMKKPSASSSSSPSSSKTSSSTTSDSTGKSSSSRSESELSPAEVEILVKQVPDLFDKKMKLKVQVPGIPLKAKITSVNGVTATDIDTVKSQLKAGQLRIDNALKLCQMCF